MDSQGYFIEPPDPNDRLPFLKVERCPKAGHLSITILSTDVEHTRVHRVDGKPVLCKRVDCKIEGCPTSGRYQGYIEAISMKEKKRVMVELTEEVYQQIRMIQAANGLRLRGLQLILKREGERRNSPISVEQYGNVTNDRDIPRERNMRPFVLRLYKVR
jgi:hypothetical protein